ncbi:AAA family ATPase [Hymenobacter edaphi]|nr:AAA family ATPase [Hymenobacter edaphi]
MSEIEATPHVPRLTYLRIRNYRALRDVELRDLTPLTVLVGPNGSGKSTVLDALAFLAEAVSGNLQQAWEKRNRFAGMRTRGSEGAIEFEVRASITGDVAVKYELSISESEGEVFVSHEAFYIVGGITKRLFYSSTEAALKRASKEKIERNAYYSEVFEDMRVIPAANPYLFYSPLFDGGSKLRFHYEINFTNLLTSYRYIHLTDSHAVGQTEQGPRERLSPSGDNLPNVLYYLQQKHPEVLQGIIGELRRQVPALAEVLTEVTSDERLLLRFRDAPFEKPLPAQYMSDGTLRLTALLTLLREPEAAGLLGLEEPENELHPRLLPRLAEELSRATEMRQLLVATHSPALLDALEPAQVWILHRGADGYTQATRVADLPDVVAMVEEGSPLGYLWERNFFDVGDPLAPLSQQPIRE